MDEDVLKDLLRVNPQDTAAAEALSQLLESEKRWEELAQHLLDRLEAGDQPRGMLYRRLAETLHEKLSASDNALVVLIEGLNELRDDTLLGEFIERLAESLNEWGQVIQLYESFVADAASPLPFHRRLAHWYGRFGDMDNEIRHRESVLKIDPSDVGSIDVLIAYYETKEDWSNLARLLHLRSTHLPEGDDRLQLLIQTGHLWADAVGRPDEALQLTIEAFRDACSPELMPHLERYAQMTGHWNTVLNAYADALQSQSDIALCIRIARIYRDQINDLVEARRYFALASSGEGWSPKLASEYRDILQALGDQRELAHRLAIDVKMIDDAEERLSLLIQRGDLLEAEKSYTEAIQTWFDVLELTPDDPSILVRLIDALRGAGRWTDAVQALKKLTVLENAPDRRAKYFHAIGVIQRDKLENNISAVRSFDQALDFNPRFLRAFHALDELLMSEGNDDRRDRYYRRMLVRCLDNELEPELIALIAKNLGELNRKALKNYEEALKAYDIALKHGEKERRIYKIVAELEAKTGRFEDAEHTLLALLQTDDSDIESYHALVSLHSRNEDLDAAFNVCRVIRLLGQAQSDEVSLYETVKAASSSLQVRPFTQACWDIFERELTYPHVGVLLELLTPALLEYVARSERAVGISSNLTDGRPHAERLVQVAASILNLPVPDVRMSKRTDLVTIGHLNVPALVASHTLKNRRRSEQLFAAARSIVLLQPTYYLATVDPDFERRTHRIRTLFATVHQWVRPDRPQPGAMPDLLALLNTLGSKERDRFYAAIEPLIPLEGYGIAEWLSALELMVNKIAFTVCDDLESAVSAMRREANPLGRKSANDRIMDLLRFVISRDYRAIRKALELSVSPTTLASS